MKKIELVIGYPADGGDPQVLYAGEDKDAAKQVYHDNDANEEWCYVGLARRVRYQKSAKPGLDQIKAEIHAKTVAKVAEDARKAATFALTPVQAAEALQAERAKLEKEVIVLRAEVDEIKQGISKPAKKAAKK